ncbi:hypothetical protein [Streptococcus sobrinus]|uniref:hypothetical protein n=1 Tax=Streptococcus sobrinus TaxID=1310 RepID=UPI0002D69EC2|nr:hypothetical protein [Streptococcus sobrinus]
MPIERSSRGDRQGSSLLTRPWRNAKIDNQSYFDLHSTVEGLDTKAIMTTRKGYIDLVDNGYLQLMEIQGKDLDSLSEKETLRILLNFRLWLTRFTPDCQIETTTLPTNTDPQIKHLRHILSDVRKELKSVPEGSQRYLQLKDREEGLKVRIQVEQVIRKKNYNHEFILWLWGKTTEELDEVISKAKRYGNSGFLPRDIPRWKKFQIIKQYNNMNEKI